MRGARHIPTSSRRRRIAEDAGASGITVPPARRPTGTVQGPPTSCGAAAASVRGKLNFEDGERGDAGAIALNVRPQSSLVGEVPERPDEVDDAEGGSRPADARRTAARGGAAAARPYRHRPLSLFLDPHPEQLERLAEIGAGIVEGFEINTDRLHAEGSGLEGELHLTGMRACRRAGPCGGFPRPTPATGSPPPRRPGGVAARTWRSSTSATGCVSRAVFRRARRGGTRDAGGDGRAVIARPAGRRLRAAAALLAAFTAFASPGACRRRAALGVVARPLAAGLASPTRPGGAAAQQPLPVAVPLRPQLGRRHALPAHRERRGGDLRRARGRRHHAHLDDDGATAGGSMPSRPKRAHPHPHRRLRGRARASDLRCRSCSDGTHPPFVPPLAARLVSPAAGGNVSYVPIAYRRGCTVSLVGAESARNLVPDRLPPAGRARRASPAFAADEDLSGLTRVLEAAGNDPLADPTAEPPGADVHAR